MRYILNIGMERSATDGLFPGKIVTPEDVYMCLLAAGFNVLHAEQRLHADRECTHVVTAEYDGPDIHDVVYALCRALDQDCIAVACVGGGRFIGELIGPRSDDWGEFNPALFDMPRVYEDAYEV